MNFNKKTVSLISAKANINQTISQLILSEMKKNMKRYSIKIL